MGVGIRPLLHNHVPATLNDPLGLSLRILKSRNPDAIFAMASAFLGILLTPLDLFLALFERSVRRGAPPPRLPIVLVVGPPRSGTTLVAQTLMKHLPVAYLNNLTALFPRSPVFANTLFRARLRNREISSRSFYGKTSHFWGPNDGLYIWDRWLGRDRKSIPRALDDPEGMVRFFGALERATGKPLVNKNNRLISCAHLVAEALPGSRFLCLRRDPVYLAQSLYIARKEILGSYESGYGLEDPGRPARGGDPIESVCDQVVFHKNLMKDQESRIGRERFWTVSYEGFCRDPLQLVRQVSERILSLPQKAPGRLLHLDPFRIESRRRIPEADFSRIRERLAPLDSHV